MPVLINILKTQTFLRKILMPPTGAQLCVQLATWASCAQIGALDELHF